MYLKDAVCLLSLILPVLGIPAPTPTQTPSPSPPTTPSLDKRQSLADLLAIASSAGIALPTNPAALISLYPLATNLVAYLPTSPVLSVLETAIPPGFLSQIVHDPSFAASFEQAFATGSPPGWFSSLPDDVRGYMHTYQVGGLVTQVGVVESAVAGANGAAGGSAATVSDVLGSILADPSTLSHIVIGQSQTGTARFGPLESGTGNTAGASSTGDFFAQTTGVTMPTGQGTTPGGNGTAAVLTLTSQQSGSGSAATGSTGSGTSQAAGMTASRTSAAPSSSTSMAAATHETSFLFAEIMAAVGAVGAIAFL